MYKGAYDLQHVSNPNYQSDRRTFGGDQPMNLYYMIWVDFIIRAKSQPANKSNWQLMTFVYMTMIMGLDLLFIMMILQEVILGYYFYDFEIAVLPNKIGDIISFVILFVGPPFVINYLLIFRNRRYEKLVKKYRSHDGKLAVTYMLLGLFVPLVVLLLGMIYGVI